MFGLRLMTRTLLTVVALGASTVVHAAADDTKLRTDLERIAKRRIFFGHQSVGMNLLDGVQQLSTMAGVPVHIKDVKTASDVQQAMIGQAFIPENGYPLKKIKSFEDDMGSKHTGLDIAFMKFCYVDVTPETNAKELFEHYRASIDNLKVKNPGTTFVHVTAPLTIVQVGLKAQLKKLFGKAPYGVIENLRREEYNNLIRQAYHGREPIFDLARMESTAKDGTVETIEWDGSFVPVLIPAYTDDGGHLNAAGKLRAARELISVLAAIPDRPLVAKPTR